MKALSFAALLLGASLAGCFHGAAPDEVDSASISGSAADPSLALPDNRTGEFAAFKETNLTDDYGHHDHDYWQGRLRVSLFEGRVEMNPAPDPSGTSAVFRPPTGAEHLVFEGTDRIEVTLSDPERRVCNPVFTLGGRFICTDRAAALPDAAASSGLVLQFLHAASNPDEWIDAGAIAWDTPVVIPIVDARWTDMPHSTGSLWVFRVVSPNPQDTTLAFKISAVAVRGEGVVPKWPGHPVFYTPTKHYREVYSGPGEVEETPDGSIENKAQPARLVSAGTRTLLVFANITGVEGAVQPTHWWMYFHNASYTNWNATNPFDANYTADHTELRWVLRVDPNGMDSPYATVSRWEFMVRGAYTTPTANTPAGAVPAFSCLSGCVSYKVKYTLTIIASDLELPAEAYSRTARAA